MKYEIISLKYKDLKFAIIDNEKNIIVERFKTLKQSFKYIKELNR